jgi:hypothetical protein
MIVINAEKLAPAWIVGFADCALTALNLEHQIILFWRDTVFDPLFAPSIYLRMPITISQTCFSPYVRMLLTIATLCFSRFVGMSLQISQTSLSPLLFVSFGPFAIPHPFLPLPGTSNRVPLHATRS